MIYGTESAKEFKSLVEPECTQLNLNCVTGGDGYGPSDHMPFYMSHVPVLHFFTGAHADYHRTTDTAEKINATGGVQIAELVSKLALILSQEKFGLTLQEQSNSTQAFGSSGDRHSYGAYLGTIPDYSETSTLQGTSTGVKLAGTRPQSPADKAGVKAGDFLTGITYQNKHHAITSLNDMMFILRELKPKDRIILHVLRDQKTLKLNAVVGKKE